jgi:hypothetical protein
MITIRNKDAAVGISARTGVAGLIPGQLVKLNAAVAAGANPLVVAPVALDYSGTTLLGIVDWYPQDSQDVDFNTTFTNGQTPLSPVAGNNSIPLDAQVTVWFGHVIVGYSKDVLPTTLKAVAAGTACGFDLATHLPAVSGDSERVNSVMVRNELGAEFTILVKL